MNRWFFIFLPILALALLALAVNSRRNTPEAGGIGQVEVATIFASWPEYAALGELQARWSAAGAVRSRIPSNLDSNNMLSGILASEWEMFRRAADDRNEHLTSFREDRSLRNLEWLFADHDTDFTRSRDSALLEAEKSLLDAYNDVSNNPQPFLKDEKLRLLNLNIQLRLLGDNSFVMPVARRDEIVELIKDIEENINDSEKNYMEQIRTKFKGKSEVLKKDFEATQKDLETQLEASVQQSLTEAEHKLKIMIEEDIRDLNLIIQTGADTRTRMTGLFSDQESGPEITTTDLPRFAVAENRLRVEFMRRLRRKAPAVARRRGLVVIFNSSYPPVSGTADLTGDFTELF